MEKVVELVGGGFVINGAYPVYFRIKVKTKVTLLLIISILTNITHMGSLNPI